MTRHGSTRGPHDLAETRARLIDLLRRDIGPQLSRARSEELLRQAKAWGSTGAYGLDAHLAEHPDAFTAPQQLCPAPLPKLLRLLAAEGFADKVSLLGCARCGRTDDDLLRPSPQGRCCHRCLLRDRQPVPCGRCQRVVVDIATRDAEGPVCRRCYYSDPDRLVQCCGCGRERPPKRRLPDGGILCGSCLSARKPTVCSHCGQLAEMRVRTASGSICRACSKLPNFRCTLCGGTISLSAPGSGDGPGRCPQCSRAIGECVVCGQVKAGSTVGNRFHCLACRPPKTRVCTLCGDLAPTCVHWPAGPVCFRCHRHRTQNPAACSSCGEVRVLIGTGDSGPTCPRCAGSDLSFACRQCGHEGDIYSKGRCRRCVAIDHVNDLICDANGNIVEQLRPFADALATAKPGTLMQWAKHTRSSQRLAQLAAGAEISHDALDRLPQGHATRYLRELLVSTGVLDPRNEPFAQLVLWSRNVVATLPERHRPIIRTFAEWAIIRDARRRAGRGRYTDAASRADRAQIRAAVGFLEWLRGVGLDIDALDQQAVDLYVSANPSKRQTLSVFVRWLRLRGAASEVEIVSRRAGSPREFQEPAEQQLQLRRCLTDDGLPLEVRVVGALIRLYALSLEDIAGLTLDQFSRDNEDSYLVIGKHPVLLPPSLARLIEQLRFARGHRALIPATSQSPYLFPGRPASRPRHPRSLRQMLNEHGLPNLSARNTAMIALVTDLPPMIVSDLLGIHPYTADRWARTANSSWGEYLAAQSLLKG